MREFKHIRSRRQILVRFLLGIGGLALLGALTTVAARAAWAMYGKFTEAAAADAQSKAELQSLEQQEAQMSAAVSSLSTPRGVEAQVRERYGVEKPGEGVIEILQPSATSSAAAAVPLNFFSKVWQTIVPW